MADKIIYNGQTIAVPAGGQIVTLPCKGKVMTGDLVVQTTKMDRSVIISDHSSITIIEAPITVDGDSIVVGG